jgi:hypothetical protein
MRSISAIISGLLALVVFGTMLIPLSEGQSAVIDQESISYDKESPKYSESVTISADVVFADSEPVTEGVVLQWGLCTDTNCEIPTKTTMTTEDNITYSATIGPFPDKDLTGNEYEYTGFKIMVTFVPLGGGEESTVESEEVKLYFDKEGSIPVDDDDDNITDDDDDDDEEDSPLGIEVVVTGILLAVAIAIYRRRK